MTNHPRAVFGFPMYNAQGLVERTLESLLAQDFEQFAIVAVDDCSSDHTFELAKRFLDDPRLTVERNERRAGMIENWNRTWRRARELHGDFEYFAWASDNDWRDTNWLSVLARALDEHPDASMAFSTLHLWSEDGAESSAVKKWEFATGGVEDRERRFRAMREGAPIGAMMYGLQRARIVDRLGAVPKTLFSDHLFLSEVALFGPMLQETGTRWYRGSQRTGGRRKRQRRALFAGRPPILTYAPVWVQHAYRLFVALVVRKQGPTDLNRLQGLRLTFLYIGQWLQKMQGNARIEISRWRTRRRKRFGAGTRVPLSVAVGYELERQVREIERYGNVDDYSHELRTEVILLSRRLRFREPEVPAPASRS